MTALVHTVSLNARESRQRRDVPRRMRLSTVASNGEERIAAAFAAARTDGRPALMPFLMGGFPSLDGSLQSAKACADAGADLIELGIPCAHPSADGPMIRMASATALQAGATVDAVLDIACALAPRVPVVIMCYAEVLLERGAQRFVQDLQAAHVSGLIVPDLAARDIAATLDACDATGVALVPLIAPTCSDEDAAQIAARARGFIYTVSVTGTTGERPALADGVGALLSRARAHSRVPVALGFGISTPAHAAQAAAAGADGVIIGSRLARALADAADPPAAARQLVAQFSAALRDGQPAQVNQPSALDRAA